MDTEPPGFPSFEESSFGQYYAAALASGVFKNDAQRDSCLAVAHGIWLRAKQRHEESQRSRDDDLGLAS